MQYLRQTIISLSALLIGIGCSDNPTQKDITDETIRLNKTLVHEGAINPKTQYLKHGEDVKVVPKVVTTKHESVNNSGIKIEKLISERDAAIRANVELKKINSNLKSQKLTLSENKSSSKEKIAVATTALLAAQQLTADRDTQIAKLITERDEAIKVTLEMKKTNTEFETQATEKIQALQSSIEKTETLLEDKQRKIDKLTSDLSHINDNIKRETQAKQKAIDEVSELKTKLTAITTKLSNTKSLTSDKDEEIDSLVQQRDEAIKATLEMKKENEELNIKLNNLIKTQSENESSSKGKIAASSSALKDAQELIADRDSKITKLIAERDEAIKVTLEMKKASEDFETQKSDWDTKVQSLMQTQSENESASKEKIAAAATALLATQQLTKNKDQELEKLIKERDEAIRVTLEMKKANADIQAQKTNLDGKLQTLTQTQSENDAVSKKKIEKLATALSEAKKSTADKDANIAKLIKERDVAIQVSMGLKKKLEEGKKVNEKNAKKLVIDNIVSTFKLSKVEFKTGSAILTDKSTKLLDKVADIMKKHTAYHYKIQGHTDSQGKKESNLKLSQARADSVKNYLISQGVAKEVLSSEGFGSSVPIADNATKEGRLQNRRVVFEIVD